MNSRLRIVQLWTTAAIASVLVMAGCRKFGTGGTGEYIAPKQQLREIEPLALSPTSRPATIPTTLHWTSSTQPLPADVKLSLTDARRMALANNLDLRIELFNPQIARESLNAERARYDALITANVNYSKLDTPTASTLNGSQVEDLSFNPGVALPLKTGGIVRLNLPIDRFETNNQFSTLNPSYSSDAVFSISQPLLRNAGTNANAYPIRVAFYQRQQSDALAKLEVIRVLADTERIYWRLYAARQELDVRRQEYDLAVVQLQRARRMVQQGASAEVEIVRADSGVADTVEAIIIAENQLADRQRELKRILNQPDLEVGSPTAIIPDSLPTPIPYSIDGDKLSTLAMQKRMELLDVELQIASESANVLQARNGLLPLVTLDYAYNINGLGSSYDDSLTMVRKSDFVDHRIGLSVEVPVGNHAARSRYRSAIARREQQLATKDQRMQQIRQEVFTVVDQLEANWQRILASRQRVILATRLLNAETRQFELGLRTSTEVLEAQTSLADARSSEIASLTEYQISQVDLAFATGTTLGANSIVWAPTTSTSR